VQTRRQQAAHRNRSDPAGDADLLPPPKPETALRFMTLNLAHGRYLGPHQALQATHGLRGNLGLVAETMREIEPDVVALQEADGPSAWSGNFDHVETLRELVGLGDHYRGNHSQLSIGRLSLDSGTALLARGPLQEPSSHSFEQSWRDTKGFVAATVPHGDHNATGLEIDVVSVHLDFLVPGVRRRQLGQLAATLGDRDRPLVLLGDFNTLLSRDHQTISALCGELGLIAWEPQLDAPTFPSSRPMRRLDWILASPELEFVSYTTLPTPLSDHLAVIADLRPASSSHGDRTRAGDLR
jgi:endonuclease/exonuclease/phosphatase family metal-dependent hydrolase